MKYFNNLKIPVQNFYSFLETNDYRFLLKKKCKLDDKKKQILEQAFTEILYCYCELIGDKTILDSLKREIYIELLEGKINALKKIVSLYFEFKDESILVLLNDLGVSFNKKKEIEPQIQTAIKKIKGLTNRYNIFILKQKKNISKNNEQPKTYNIEEQALTLEINLGLNYPIDVSTCTLGKWVSMIKKMKTKKNG